MPRTTPFSPQQLGQACTHKDLTGPILECPCHTMLSPLFSSCHCLVGKHTGKGARRKGGLRHPTAHKDLLAGQLLLGTRHTCLPCVSRTVASYIDEELRAGVDLLRQLCQTQLQCITSWDCNLTPRFGLDLSSHNPLRGSSKSTYPSS